MDPVSNLSALIETLRRQVPTGLDRSLAVKAQHAKTQAPRNKRASLSELGSTLAQRIQAINPDDKRRHHKAVRIFLETILVNEFGDGLLTDPKFSEVIEEIQATMDADSAISKQLDSLVAELAKTT
jgi:hypothetical protein